MAIYNVLAAVVDLIEADSEAEACAKLEQRLLAAGFEPYDGQPTTAFESEPL
jgi:hypothetical protein